MSLKEFKFFSKEYDETFTLLILPRQETVWENKFEFNTPLY